MKTLLSCMILMGILTGIAQAQDTSSTSPTSTAANGLASFGGGVGIAVCAPSGPPIVTAASIDNNGILRASTTVGATAKFAGEVHAYPWKSKSGAVGVGPVVSAVVGSTSIIESIIIGGMVGFHTTGTHGLGIAVGYAITPAQSTLSSQFKVNQPSPSSSVSYQNITTHGLGVVVSFGF